MTELGPQDLETLKKMRAWLKGPTAAPGFCDAWGIAVSGDCHTKFPDRLKDALGAHIEGGWVTVPFDVGGPDWVDPSLLRKRGFLEALPNPLEHRVEAANARIAIIDKVLEAHDDC